MIMLQEDPRRSFGSVGSLDWILGNCKIGYIVVSSRHVCLVYDGQKLVWVVYLCFSHVPLMHSLGVQKHTFLKKIESFHMQSRRARRYGEASLGKSFGRKWILRCFLSFCPLFPSPHHVSSSRAELCDHIICHPLLGVTRGTVDSSARAAGREPGHGSTWFNFPYSVRMALMPPHPHLWHLSRSVLPSPSVYIPDMVCHLSPSPWTVSDWRARAVS